EEVTEFLKFLQNSAKKCAQDYNMLSDDACLFTVKILRACIEQLKKFLEFYTLHEVTSLMVFFPFRVEMELKLEKSLLALGRVKYVKTVFPSMLIKLQKDPNAEKLISRYHPQLALTSQSLFTLLNNHEPTYKEPWGLSVLIQVIPVAGSKPVKVIYINWPLPRNKITMREGKQIFHEVPLKFMMSQNTFVPVSAVFMDKPEEFISEMDMSHEFNECRKIETFENLYLDFDDEVTELETFGVTTTKASKSLIPASTSTVPNMTDAPTAPKAVTTPVAPSAPDISEKQLVTGMDVGPEECKNKDDQSLNHVEIETSNKNDMTIDMEHADGERPNVLENLDNSKEKTVRSEAAKTEDTVLFSSDTDEECLIIDRECKNNSDGKTDVVGSNLSFRSASPNSSSGQASVGKQTTTVCRPAESCVFFKKRQLPYELQDYVEDTSEYLAPQKGNFVYKLFSLQDLFFLMCCKQKKIRRQFPVDVLPKVEYQACYGVEALIESELCHLRTESLLNSNSSFYVGHIDAFTSKHFLLEETTSEELKEKLSALKISNLFNILQHILKKLSSLQEGSYLLYHAAEDSSLLNYKVSVGKVTRTAYNLYKTHCSLPGVPFSLSFPRVPLDPRLLLPYHIHHGRIPCTFPPKSLDTTTKRWWNQNAYTQPQDSSFHRNLKQCLPAQQVETEGVLPNKRKIT
uniref:Little elongation complex subunit 2 C-terminal domain-containing protein n=1 Tax=Pan paniscus TaxID=9597 RepID=A0A2R9CSU7_PANPA